MKKNNLSLALSDSLHENVVDSISEVAEVGLDIIMEDGVLKEIPILSTVISVYRIGKDIKSRYNIKKLAIFIDEINSQIVSNEKRDDYRNKIQENIELRNKEIEYLIVLIDRYLNYDKPKLLAKLYLSYLNGNINWEELCGYAEIIDRFILFDLKILIESSTEFYVRTNDNEEVYLRLEALGLLKDISNNTPFVEEENGSTSITSLSLLAFQNKEKKYKKTGFGEKLVFILQ